MSTVIPAGTACWTCHPHGRLKVGTAVVTLEDHDPYERAYTNAVRVRDEKGREYPMHPHSISRMLDEEIPHWCKGVTIETIKEH